MKNYLLIGSGINNSLSPFIHQEFAKQFGMQISYGVVDISHDKISATIEAFIKNAGAGINVTSPYKEVIFNLLRNHHPRAIKSRSVNTVIIKEDGSLWGDNTDGVGLIKDLERHCILVKNRCVLIFGAGGAVRGILPGLIDLRPNKIVLMNRDLVKANKIAEDFKQYFDVEINSYDKISLYQPSLVINATSNTDVFASFELKSSCRYYDLNYKQKPLDGVVNGLGMLVEQAAISFELWHGKTPNVQKVLQMLKQGL